MVGGGGAAVAVGAAVVVGRGRVVVVVRGRARTVFEVSSVTARSPVASAAQAPRAPVNRAPAMTARANDVPLVVNCPPFVFLTVRRTEPSGTMAHCHRPLARSG